MIEKLQRLLQKVKNGVTVGVFKELEIFLEILERHPTWYVVVPLNGGASGENTSVFSEKEDALLECRDWVEQHLCDHQYEQPLKVTPEISRHFDIRLFETCGEVELPLQEWTDGYYEDTKDQLKGKEDQEYQRYLELKAKYEPENE